MIEIEAPNKESKLARMQKLQGEPEEELDSFLEELAKARGCSTDQAARYILLNTLIDCFRGAIKHHLYNKSYSGSHPQEFEVAVVILRRRLREAEVAEQRHLKNSDRHFRAKMSQIDIAKLEVGAGRSGFKNVYPNASGFRAWVSDGKNSRFLRTWRDPLQAAWERYQWYRMRGIPYGQEERGIAAVGGPLIPGADRDHHLAHQRAMARWIAGEAPYDDNTIAEEAEKIRTERIAAENKRRPGRPRKRTEAKATVAGTVTLAAHGRVAIEDHVNHHTAVYSTLVDVTVKVDDVVEAGALLGYVEGAKAKLEIEHHAFASKLPTRDLPAGSILTEPMAPRPPRQLTPAQEEMRNLIRGIKQKGPAPEGKIPDATLHEPPWEEREQARVEAMPDDDLDEEIPVEVEESDDGMLADVIPFVQPDTGKAKKASIFDADYEPPPIPQ